MERVLITGGRGLVGRYLCKALQEKGYDVAILSRTRKKENEIPTYTWNWNRNEIEEEAINAADYIVHLAGVNIGEKRWTTERRQQILDSRVRTAELIFNKTEKLDKRPKAFITASAIGYYGARTTEEIYNETAPPYDDFLGQTCSRWEQVADKFSDIGVRPVKIRTGIVLSKDGGVLSRFKLPTKMGLGIIIGDGKQFFPWIHMQDLCNIYMAAIENTQMVGAYNAVAPEQITNSQLIKILAEYLNKPFWFLKMPAWAIRLFIGQRSDMLLYGSRVSSDKIRATGYEFVFPDLKGALKQLYSYKNLIHI